MRVGLFTDLAGQRVWHRWLAQEFERLGDQFSIHRPTAAGRHCPPGLRLALWLDPIWYRLSGEHAFDAIEGNDTTVREGGGSDSPLDVLIDFGAGCEGRPAAARTVRVSFRGVNSELAAVAPVLGNDPVTIELTWSPAGPIEIVSPSVVRRECLTTSLDIVFSSLVEILTERIANRPPSDAAVSPHTAMAPKALHAGIDGARHVTRLVTEKLARYLGSRAAEPARWAIATRSNSSGRLFDELTSNARFDLVPDDGKRYYADPLFFSRDGRTHLFCEEYPLSTRRGIISVAEIQPNGAVGAFRPALERPYHLSYPFVFQHDDQTWMVPETCESGAVELYRAEQFPDRWVFDRILINNIRACDATIIEHGGEYWMILTATRWLGSTSDKQRVYVSKSPLGPWSEHAAGLLRLDSTCARPAGPAFRRRGKLLRPAQDCSTRYGGAMTLMEVQELSTTSVREVSVAKVGVTSPTALIATHTYAEAPTVEAIDVFGLIEGIKSAELTCQPTTTSQVSDTAGSRRSYNLLRAS